MATTNSRSSTRTNETHGIREQKRRPQRMALLFAVLAISIALIGFLWLGVWPETIRREAYLPELENMAHRSPYDGRLLALVGARQLEAHEYSTAASSLRQALAAGEESSEIRLSLAAALEAGGDRPRALAHLRMALQEHPQDTELQAALGRIQKVDTPVPAGFLAPALCPDGPNPLIATYTKGSFLNGLMQWWGHRYPEKSGYATRALWVREHPDDAQAQRLWGLALVCNRRLMEAETAMRKAVALAPQTVETHISLAELQEQSGELAAASLEYLAALKIQRDCLPALLGLGRTSLNGSRIADAIRCFRRATEIEPTSFEAWTYLGRSYQLTGIGYDKSAAAYKKAIALEPDNTDFLNDYAISLFHMSQQDNEAERVLRRRLETAPKDSLSHYLLGKVLMNTNPTPARIVEAETQTREAIRLDEGNPMASVQLAQLLFQQNKESPECIRLLNQAIQTDAYNRTSRFLLARVYRRIGKAVLAHRVAAEGDKLFQNQQKLANLADKERKNQLDDNGRRQLAHYYEITGDHNKAQHQREILALLKTDSQAPQRVQHSYDESIDLVLGLPKTPLERD